MNKKLIVILCAVMGMAPVLFSTRQCAEVDGSRKETMSVSKSSSAASLHVPADLKDRPSLIVKHSGHVLSYNTSNNTPNWVAWMVTREMLKGTLERSTKFWADPSIPKAYRVDYYEYKESAYDRGHMCPAGDCKWSQDAMHDCFYMSNMCPQDRTLNSHSWEYLESRCRTWAAKEGAVFICAGPYYDKSKQHEKIGIHHKIVVPDGFFKVVLSLRKGSEKAIGFYYANTSKYQPVDKVACSVDEIERKTGIDFFADLDDKLEAKVERMNDINAWK